MKEKKFLKTYAILLCIILPKISIAHQQTANLLTQKEKTWLASHPVIKLAPDPDFPPIEFMNENGEFAGITADYVRLLEKNLRIKFQIIHLENWNQILEAIQKKQVDMLSGMVETPQRSEYLLFTKPFFDIPAVIVTRKTVHKTLTLNDLNNMRVAIVSNTCFYEEFTEQHPEIEVDPVPNTQTGLRKVSFGIDDAMITNLTIASYYNEKLGIVNLHVAGDVNTIVTRLAMASRNDWPELNNILEKGLATISQKQRKAIHDNWITIGQQSFFENSIFLYIFSGILLISMLIIFWFWTLNQTLKKRVKERTKELHKELNERKQAEDRIKKSLEEKNVLLQEIHHRVNNNMQIICSLLHLQVKQTTNKEMREFIDTCSRRIYSMAMVHEKVYQSENLSEIDFSVYIKKLSERLFNAHISDYRNIDLKLNIEKISIPLSQAIPCGLVINELIINALKHAFPSSFEEKPKIQIDLTSVNRHVNLIIQDNGIGIPENINPKQTESTGFKLIYLLTEDQIGGTISLNRKTGTKFTIRFPHNNPKISPKNHDSSR